MKNLIITSIIALLVAGWSIAGAQTYSGLPGDNLNLYAVMKLFQESETLEGFERNLNDENSMINNLDLNGDNLVDYIMVFDYVDGNVHTIVLRTALDQYETQDIAVFSVQRFRNGSVQIQLVGDEMLYGKDYIIEPMYADAGETPNPGYMGNVVHTPKTKVVHTTVYEVATWPLIRSIFLPSYVVWHSSWRWGYYPVYWNPWRPFYWHTYYGYHNHWHHHYYAHYRHWNHYRHPRYKNYYYTNIRTYSPRINVNINSGKYRTTYSRPDLRRKGEVIARRSSRNSNAVKSSSVSRVRSSGSTTVRRSGSNNRSSVERRSTTGASAGQRAVSTRKSTTTQSSGRVQNSSGTRSTRTATRSSSSSTPRSTTVTRPSSSNKSSTVRQRTNSSNRVNSTSSGRELKSSSIRPSVSTRQKSSSTVTNRSSSKPRSTPKVNSSRSSSRSSGSSVNRSNSGSRSRSSESGTRSRSSSSRSSGRR
ncbi:hypothetical protein SAMN05444274_103464 [Mariniphaga anaerophila]|uniref:DUF3300 domain-containing protein n=1 Tax=Mariniphaga anaerophila TaxID=1484053 RepID=A0A1M4YUL0_9BACT|nr:hypothetical protein [Mariniphaga anaerophila]SHF09267.1 hypothetical protein SAMN05444274_103464 [Mariniphaga anaerophila]